MKKILGFVLMAAMLVSIMPTSYASDGNLVSNPGFETDTIGWVESDASVTRTQDEAYEGNAAGLVIAENSGYTGVSLTFKKGQKYQISSRIKTRGNTAFFNTFVKHTDGSTEQVALLRSTDDRWNEMKGEYLHRRADETVTVYITTNNTAKYYIDNLVVVPLGEPIKLENKFTAAGETVVVVDSVKQTYPVYPADGAVLVPAVRFAKAINGSGYSKNAGVVLGRGLSTMTLTDGNIYAEANGVAKKLSVAPRYINGELYADVTDIGTILGADVVADSSMAVVSSKTTERKLNASARKLRENKKLNIGFLTGSIVQRAGTWDPYTVPVKTLIKNWFESTFADCEINVIEFDQSGTGSMLGAYTTENFVRTSDIDLLIVDFFRNDINLSAEEAEKYCESVIRAAKRGKNDVDVIWTYGLACNTVIEFGNAGINQTSMVQQELYKNYTEGAISPVRDAFEKVATLYSVPTVDVGKALYADMEETGSGFVYYHNKTHNPNTQGSEIYGAELIKLIRSCLENTADKSPVIGKAYGDVIVGEVASVKGAALGEGWTYHNKAILSSTTPDYIEASVGGSELVYKFNGNIIGLYFDDHSASGNYYYSIDGSEYKEATTFVCGSYYPHLNTTIFSDNLSDGEHTLKIKVSAEKNPNSKSTVVRIAGFLVGINE